MVLWLQRDLQHFGPTDHSLHAGRSDSFPSDTVNLVERMWFQEPLVCCPYEDLQSQRSCALVPRELQRWLHACFTMNQIDYNTNFVCDCRVNLFSLWGCFHRSLSNWNSKNTALHCLFVQQYRENQQWWFISWLNRAVNKAETCTTNACISIYLICKHLCIFLADWSNVWLNNLSLNKHIIIQEILHLWSSYTSLLWHWLWQRCEVRVICFSLAFLAFTRRHTQGPIAFRRETKKAPELPGALL